MHHQFWFPLCLAIHGNWISGHAKRDKGWRWQQRELRTPMIVDGHKFEETLQDEAASEWIALPELGIARWRRMVISYFDLVSSTVRCRCIS
jgi:DNA-directed RNA polymerase subunit N (RpoN/RPB10)